MDAIPDWLQPVERPQSDTPMQASLALTQLPAHPRTREEKQLVESTYEKIFITSLDKVAAGASLRFLAQTDHRNIAVGRFIKWVKSDPHRNRQFEEAQAVAAEILMMESVEIADGIVEDGKMPTEVDRDKLRLDTRAKLASFWNPKKYGDVKRVEMTTQTITDENINQMTTEELIAYLKRTETSTSNTFEHDNIEDGELVDQPEPVTSDGNQE
jgi:hypothetical protein